MKKLTIILLFIAAIFSSCNQGMKQGKVIEQNDDPNAAKIIEVIDGTSYTYLMVEKNGQELWLATDLFGFKQGDIVYFETGLEMKNFESKELQRTFESIYFVDKISSEAAGKEDPHAGMMGDTPQKPVLEKEDVQIELPKDGVTIAELYANRKDYEGKTIKVRGKVTKVNVAIMGRNWVHIQDGTADGDNFDLTLTTEDEPQVGDVETYTGTVVLEKDFGYGYYYDLILENASPLIHQ